MIRRVEALASAFKPRRPAWIALAPAVRAGLCAAKRCHRRATVRVADFAGPPFATCVRCFVRLQRLRDPKSVVQDAPQPPKSTHYSPKEAHQ